MVSSKIREPAMKRLICCAVLVLLASGCVMRDPEGFAYPFGPTTQDMTAEICVVFDSQSMQPVVVRAGDRKMGVLDCRSYLKWKTRPGPVSITLSGQGFGNHLTSEELVRTQKSVKAIDGKTIYLRLKSSFSLFGGTKLDLEPLTEAEASKKMTKCVKAADVDLSSALEQARSDRLYLCWDILAEGPEHPLNPLCAYVVEDRLFDDISQDLKANPDSEYGWRPCEVEVKMLNGAKVDDDEGALSMKDGKNSVSIAYSGFSDPDTMKFWDNAPKAQLEFNAKPGAIHFLVGTAKAKGPPTQGGLGATRSYELRTAVITYFPESRLSR